MKMVRKQLFQILVWPSFGSTSLHWNPRGDITKSSHKVFHCLFPQCIALSLGSRPCTAATCCSLFHWLGAIHCDWECSRRLPSTQPYTMCYLSTVSCLPLARESSTTKNAQLLLSSFHQQTSTTMRLQCILLTFHRLGCCDEARQPPVLGNLLNNAFWKLCSLYLHKNLLCELQGSMGPMFSVAKVS